MIILEHGKLFDDLKQNQGYCLSWILSFCFLVLRKTPLCETSSSYFEILFKAASHTVQSSISYITFSRILDFCSEPIPGISRNFINDAACFCFDSVNWLRASTLHSWVCWSAPLSAWAICKNSFFWCSYIHPIVKRI